jgi:hypothetical protein
VGCLIKDCCHEYPTEGDNPLPQSGVWTSKFVLSYGEVSIGSLAQGWSTVKVVFKSTNIPSLAKQWWLGTELFWSSAAMVIVWQRRMTEKSTVPDPMTPARTPFHHARWHSQMTLHRFPMWQQQGKKKESWGSLFSFFLYFSPLCSSLLTYICTFIYVRLKCTNIAVRRTQSLAGKPSLNHDLCQGKKKDRGKPSVSFGFLLRSSSGIVKLALAYTLGTYMVVSYDTYG